MPGALVPAKVVFQDRVNNIVDNAAAGEIRFEFRDPLTGAEDTLLDNTLTAHSSTGTTSDQDRARQDAIDLDRLITDLPNVTTMSDTDFKDHVERLTRVVVRDLKTPKPAV